MSNGFAEAIKISENVPLGGGYTAYKDNGEYIRFKAKANYSKAFGLMVAIDSDNKVAPGNVNCIGVLVRSVADKGNIVSPPGIAAGVVKDDFVVVAYRGSIVTRIGTGSSAPSVFAITNKVGTDGIIVGSSGTGNLLLNATVIEIGKEGGRVPVGYGVVLFHGAYPYTEVASA